jgi:uncharacterized delta-60 repeat protein
MSISNINAVPYNTIQYISGIPILSISSINGVQTTIAPPLQYLLIGGQFTIYNVISLGGITKLDNTGNLDPSFNMGAGFSSGTPYFFIQQPDGKYLTGGFNITQYSGSSNSRVVRINQNGTKDTTFNLGPGFNNSPYGAASYPDNSNIFVGNFLTYSGSTVNGLLKTTPSGSRDTSFNIGFGFANNGIGPSQAVALQSDGKAIIGVQSNQYSSSNNSITRTDLSGSYNAGSGTTFNYGIGMGLTNGVYTAVTQSDGKIILGGNFTSYSGSAASRIVRINPNGTQDTSFVTGVGFNTSVHTIQVQTDGKIIVGGLFTTYSGSTVNYITRLNPNGTRDLTFNTGTAASSTVWKTHIQADGKIVAVGNFSTYSGSSNPGIVRINDSGSKDTTFNVGAGTVGAAFTLTPTGSQYIIGGNFTSYSGSTQNYITRINTDGTRDTLFNIGAGFNNVIYGTDVEPNGKVIVAGAFTTYSGSSTNTTRITRLNPNGTQDTSFVTGTGFSGFTANPSHLSVESDGKIYAGSGFTTYSGSTVNNFVRINPSGSIDLTFPLQLPASRAGFSTTVRSLFISSSNIYFFGDFTGFRPNAGGLIRLNTDGTQDLTFYTGNNIASGANPYKILVLNDGKILVMGGSMTPYSGSNLTSPFFFRLNSDGTLDTTFTPGAGPNSNVISAATGSDGKIVLVGLFTSYSGSSVNRIVRINPNGTRDTTFNVGTGLDTFVNGAGNGNVIITPDNSVYVAGSFTTYSGSIVNRIIKIQPSGIIDPTFIVSSSLGIGFNNNSTQIIQSGSSVIMAGQFTTYKNSSVGSFGRLIDSTGAVSSSFNVGVGFGSTVRTWATQSDGKILAGGQFTTYSGSTNNYIVRINPNGTRDTSFVTGTGFNNVVTNINIQSDGKIIVIGSFTTYSGSSSSGIIRLNTNGTRDTTFNVGAGLTLSNTANHSTLQSDGKIIVGGFFTTYSGSTSNRIVRINTDGTRDTTFNVGVGFNNTVETVILQPDGKILINGNFTTYSGSAINRILRLNTNGTRDTTFNVGNGLASSGTSLALQNDGKILCASLSQTYSGSTNRYLIRINSNGTLDNIFNANINSNLSQTSNTPNSLKIASDGKIYWGNSFTTFSGSFTPNRIVRLNTNGSVDETFNQAYSNYINNTGKGANGTIQAVLLLNQ